MDLFGGRELRDNLSFGEPCGVGDERVLSLLPWTLSDSLDTCPPVEISSSVVSVSWACLREAGRLVSIGDGNGDASLDPFETVIGSGILETFSFSEFLPAFL